MPRSVVYLLGAGATHAELAAVVPEVEESDGGLLISHVSRRVMAKATEDPEFYKGIEAVAGATGYPNIELLISLIENSRVPCWNKRTSLLKDLVEADIRGILSPPRVRRFYLHKGLLTLHMHASVRRREELVGVISLNYDDVVDQAFRKVLGCEPNYCFSAAERSDCLPLLKLHGSFGWRAVPILGRRRDVDIIPLGSGKTYIHSPYGAIWNRALSTLAECDVLRVIGCSLSPNDLHLIDLIFKAQLERKTAFDIEIIDSEETGERARANYGFFGESIKILSDLGVTSGVTGPHNPFRTWLHYRAERFLGEEIMRQTPYLKTLLT